MTCRTSARSECVVVVRQSRRRRKSAVRGKEATATQATMKRAKVSLPESSEEMSLNNHREEARNEQEMRRSLML